MSPEIFPTCLTGGLVHSTEGDIQSIRDLLDGYGNSRSILKELIQNTEDSCASQMDILYIHGDKNAVHPLFHSPGLIVANNGRFDLANRKAIRGINIGTRATEAHSIGRFGKGLKSVFHLCEAFFIIARTKDSQNWSEPYIMDICNPWSGWLHDDWESLHKKNEETNRDKVCDILKKIYPQDQPWLAFWFPLRIREHAQNGDSDDNFITNKFFDSTLIDELSKELRELAPSLVFLRSLAKISLGIVNNTIEEKLNLQFPSKDKRIPAPDSRADATPAKVVGDIQLKAGDKKEIINYSGYAGRLEDNVVSALKDSDEWPIVAQRTLNGLKSNCPVKGEPHFASLLAWSEVDLGDTRGSLEIRWCVFFPVGKQPSRVCKKALSIIPFSITLNLHGFFFLDSKRLRIDGLEDAFQPQGETSLSACIQWNQLLAYQGTLAWLPDTLNEFVKQSKMNSDQCVELSNAFKDLGVWEAFQTQIIRINTWRPLWRSGAETWELIPAIDPVFRIPRITEPSQIFSRIPKLAVLSQDVALISPDTDGHLPGLHNGNVSHWHEGMVLELLEEVQLGDTGDQAVADWLNAFLAHLHEDKSLTPSILECVSHLPLLSVCISRGGDSRRISMVEWNAAIASEKLFARTQQTEEWLRYLHPALPEWCCFIHDRNIPRWFVGKNAPSLNIHTASFVVVAQSRLGEFNARAGLVRQFLSMPVLPNEVSFAVRYLMHGHAPQARDGDHFLFMPSTQALKLIWSRLIKQLLIYEGGKNSWRLLDKQWASILSPQRQEDLKVSSVDEHGAWKELMIAQADFSTLEFLVDEWSDVDVATLLNGLFQAGQSNTDGTVALLRKLRLHKLRGQGTERVAIAAADGRLAELFVLHTLNFEDGIPQELVHLWERFLSRTKVVERVTNELASTVQEKLFRTSTADGEEYENTLNWNYVVRRCLGFSEQHEWLQLIMEGLSHGDQAVRALGTKLKETKWLPLSSDGVLAPKSIILIEGFEEKLHELLDPAEGGLAGVRELPDSVVKHKGFATLKKYFPDLNEALRLLGLWLKERPKWHLGLVESSLPPEAKIASFLKSIENISDLPAAALLTQLWALPDQDANEGWKSLLRDKIWPAVLRSFNYDEDGANRLESVLKQLAETPSRLSFDAYLCQAVSDSVVVPMLSRLSLVNQRGKWCPAHLLIWPSANLDPAVQLCEEQADILRPIRATSDQPINRKNISTIQGQLALEDIKLSSSPDFGAQAKILEGYIQPFRDGNIGDLLPAALAAFLGEDPEMLILLGTLLQSGDFKKPDEFREYLLGQDNRRILDDNKKQRFLIEVIRDKKVSTKTLTGETVEVSLAAAIETLIVGENLWRRCSHHGRIETHCHRLLLRAIEQPDNLYDPVAIFFRTITKILTQVHLNGAPQNILLEDILRQIADTGQADLRRSQLYLRDMVEARLKELAVRGIQEFEPMLQKFSDARQARVDAKLLEGRSPKLAKTKQEESTKLVLQAEETLSSLLESPGSTASRGKLVDAVRRKMTDFQYSLDSVLLEIFQNADDAVTEWREMKKGELDQQERKFVVHFDPTKRLLDFIHWGRQINRYAFSGFSYGRERGYDADLQKMLTLNFSDKGVGREDKPVIVTGRFGLGFKTVFFVSDQPEVISGRLAFEIRGGFYPLALEVARAKDLRDWAKSQGPSTLVPTAIRLPWAASILEKDISSAFEEFQLIAPLLAIFAVNIHEIKMIKGPTETTITTYEKELTESGRLTHITVAQARYICFRCPLMHRERRASVLMPLNSGGATLLPKEMRRIWITTPTGEHSESGWALNAPFKPDAGRQRLALNNPLNKQIAEEVSHAWLELLLELFECTANQWGSFASRLGLDSSATFISWWKQIWRVMSSNQPATKWENLSDGGQVLGYVAWAESTGAMLRLMQQRSVIPTHLPVSYDRLVKSEDVHFSVTGLLADENNGCFALISEWPAVQSAYPPGKTVGNRVAHFLRQVIPTQTLQGELNLSTALKAELGNNQEADPSKAERIGQLFLQCSANFQPTSTYAPEVLPILSSLAEIKLLASDGQYYFSKALVCARSNTGFIEKDEENRAKFAPASAILSSDYSDAALHFFIKARGQLAANAATLKGWVKQATSDQLPAIFQYLVNGELDQQLADHLGRGWFDLKRENTTFLSLPDADKSELERKFLKGQTWNRSDLIISSLEDLRVTQIMDPNDAFQRVSDWWQQESETHIASYHDKTYPNPFCVNLPWPHEDGWNSPGHSSPSSGWLILFIHAALVPLGFNKIGRHQSFTQFLISNKWVDVFAAVSEKPLNLLKALDKYLGDSIQNTQFHFQMRQFIAFYAVAQNMESFLHSLYEAERSTEPNCFNAVFTPNTNPLLTGTGIAAPPLNGMLGIGTCQLLRELYRLGRLKNPRGYGFAFTPIRKVRRFCTQLFGTDEGYKGAFSSNIIFSKLQLLSIRSQPTLDPTFKHCFDIPLQILAENKELRTRVLQKEFEFDPEDTTEHDAEASDFGYSML